MRKSFVILTFTFLFAINLFADSEAILKVLKSAQKQTTLTKFYDPSYSKIKYPMGDVPMERGVCTDVVIRSFRDADVDLQQLVHEDMVKNFAKYPRNWGLKAPDSNIDNRRVPNLMTFFKRQKKDLPVTKTPSDFLPGDVVVWKLSEGVLHIGLIADDKAPDTKHHLVIHNIGAGTRLEDILFAYPIMGHYRYF
jgi:uncharacterized protein